MLTRDCDFFLVFGELLGGDIRSVSKSLVIDDHQCTSGMYLRNPWREVSDLFDPDCDMRVTCDH